VYFVDWNGGLYKADKYTGEVLWFREVGPLFGQFFSATRSSPALSGDRLIINSMVGARVAAVRKSDGTTIWSTTLPVTTSYDSMTNSPMIHNGVIYTSTMCGAEQCEARNEGYECCQCVGQLFAISVETGDILWSTKTLPEKCDGFANEEVCTANCEEGDGACQSRCVESCSGGLWYSGASIWGSSFVVDEARNQMIVPIGNMYTVPPSVTACMNGSPLTQGCLPDDALGSSVASFNLTSGELLWNFRSDVYPYDAWNNGCEGGNPNCPNPEGFDFDISHAPTLVNMEGGTQVLSFGGKRY
jgi:polyvinyl alcohol dehydrogenase (cytochrome)